MNKNEQTPVVISPISPGSVPPAPRWIQRCWPPVFFLVIAILFSWPLASRLGEQVILAGSGDVWQHLWNIWWMRFSLLELHTHPYTTPMLFHPAGANLFFHALDPLDGYLSIPLQLLFGLVAAFNLIILLQLTLAGYGAFLLARYLTGNTPSALVAGLIYACSPLESRLLNLGQLELTSIEWLPFYILCFLKTLNRDRRPWLWRGLCVGLLLTLSLSTWYYLLYAVLFSLLLMIYRLWQERHEWRRVWPQTLLLSGGIMAVYGILVLPVLIPTLLEAGQSGVRQPPFAVIYNSGTLKGLFTTGPSLLWGLFGSADNLEYRGNFLGYIALGLGLLGLATCFRRVWFWGAVAGLFLILSLGPVLHLSFVPDLTPQAAEVGLSLPGRLLYNLPFGNIARVPLRFVLITMLCLGLLAAYGLDWLNRQHILSRLPWLKHALPALAAVLVLLEFFPGSRTVASTTVPAFYQQIKNEAAWNDFAVVEAPDQVNNSIISRAMYYQTVHGHPLIGGYLSRKPPYYLGINELLNLERRVLIRDIVNRAALSNTIGVLQYYKVRYVIVHPQLLLTEDSRYNAREVLLAIFGQDAKPFYEDNEIQAWRMPEARYASGTPDAARVLPHLGEGWGIREDNPNGPERVIIQQARLALFNPYSQPLSLRLNVMLRTAAGQQRVAAILNNQTGPDNEVTGNPQLLSLNLVLLPGFNDVVFKTNGPVYFSRFNFANN